MAVKTITIDTEAYKRLKSHKKPNESFSDTIKRLVKKPFDVDAWLKKLEGIEFSPEAVKGIEDAVKSRRRGINTRGRRALP